MSDVQMSIEERLIQMVGHFYKYDVMLDKNILVKGSLFLCIDKVVKEDGSNRYLLNVVDQAQEVSYCSCVIQNASQITL